MTPAESTTAGGNGGPHPHSDLDPDQRRQLEAYLDCLARSHVSLSSVREGKEAWQVHVLDSLSGLALSELADARRIADLGAGAGFPGVVLAVKNRAVEVDLVESVQRKCEFMHEALGASGIENARPVCARSEEWAAGEGREAYDAVTARAVAPLGALAELASPLLGEGGYLIAWKGGRDAEEEEQAASIAAKTAMEPVKIVATVPFKGSRERHLHLLRKSGPTPQNLPRRPGMARKRPLT